MRHALLLPSLLLLATPALSAEIACEGPFAADSSEQRLKEAFGDENVVTGDAPGPEGTTILATTVYPDDPERMMVFGWWARRASAPSAMSNWPQAIRPSGWAGG